MHFDPSCLGAAVARASRQVVATGRLLVAAALLTMGATALAQAPITISFAGMYGPPTVRGLTFSDELRAADGRTVEMLGYMAPPLKAELDFFVLTRVPLAVCPFCDDASSWPPDIVFVRLPAGELARATGQALRVVGRLELGVATDEATGFVSLVRIYLERMEPVR